MDERVPAGDAVPPGEPERQGVSDLKGEPNLPDGAVLEWRGLRLNLRDGREVELPDLALLKGSSVLAVHREPIVLRSLARLAAARSHLEGFKDLAVPTAGVIRWEGKTLEERARPGERLGLFRIIALVDSHSRLLTGKTLIEGLELDLEYNQGLVPKAAERAALETLERLELENLADASQEELSGPDRGLALMLDRPMSLMDDKGFELAWRAVAEDLRGEGRAALVFDYSPEAWTGGLSANSILSL